MEDKVQKAYDYLNLAENKHLKEFVKTFAEKNGFSSSTAPEYKEIMDYLEEDGHSGCSLAICMRSCQKIFNLESQKSS